MKLFLCLHTGNSLYPYQYLGTYIDEYDVRLVSTKHYSVKHEEVRESKVLYKDISETFIIATEDIDSTLQTKHIWK